MSRRCAGGRASLRPAPGFGNEERGFFLGNSLTEFISHPAPERAGARRADGRADLVPTAPYWIFLPLALREERGVVKHLEIHVQ